MKTVSLAFLVLSAAAASANVCLDMISDYAEFRHIRASRFQLDSIHNSMWGTTHFKSGDNSLVEVISGVTDSLMYKWYKLDDFEYVTETPGLYKTISYLNGDMYKDSMYLEYRGQLHAVFTYEYGNGFRIKRIRSKPEYDSIFFDAGQTKAFTVDAQGGAKYWSRCEATPGQCECFAVQDADALDYRAHLSEGKIDSVFDFGWNGTAVERFYYHEKPAGIIRWARPRGLLSRGGTGIDALGRASPYSAHTVLIFTNSRIPKWDSSRP